MNIVYHPRFRWVECHLDDLRDTIQEVHEALDSLPQTLDETYERILLQIPPKKARYASVVFNLLSSALRPVTLEETAEVIAVDLASGSFD
jgi:hypothetical protein